MTSGPIALLVSGAVGLILGSFNNVLIHRLPRGESVVWPGSRCPACGHSLSWWENVPLLSFLLLRGRCHACRAPISWRYPLVEGVTGVGVLYAYLRHGLTWEGVASAALAFLLVPVVFIDLEHRIIPDRITLPGIVLGLALSFARGGLHGLWQAALAGLGAGAFFLAVAVLSRGGMGGGDVKLAAMLGAFTDPARVLVGTFLGVLAGGLVGLGLLGTGRKRRKDAIPFGPFLAAGGFAG
ncbi:MAG: prepilin peptidase, partial [Armatimonadota bacterium]|nr:prepilin peptidase [Armatimonadota bacterium]